MKEKSKKNNYEKIVKKTEKELGKYKLEKVMNFNYDIYYHLVMAARDFATILDDPNEFDHILISFCDCLTWRIEDYERENGN